MRADLAAVLGIFVVALASMVFYAVTGRHRKEDHLESGARGDFVLGSFTRSWFYWAIHPILQLSLAAGLSPLFYNLAGVVLGCAGGVAFALGNPVLGGWGVLLGGRPTCWTVVSRGPRESPLAGERFSTRRWTDLPRSEPLSALPSGFVKTSWR